jgi:hypothetical protein
MGWLLTGRGITPNFDKRSGFRPRVLYLGFGCLPNCFKFGLIGGREEQMRGADWRRITNYLYDQSKRGRI